MVHAQTLWELMERRVDATPDALMAVDEDMRTLTFAEYWSDAERAAAGLAAGGIGAGDVVTWQLPNWIESLVLVAALARIDAVQNPLFPTEDLRELTNITDKARTALLVTPSRRNGVDHEELATDVARHNGEMRVLVADRALPQGDPTALAPLPDPLDPGAPQGPDGVEGCGGWLFYTAGSTTDPKGVRHSDATIIAAAEGLVSRLGLIAHDRHALVAPLSHVDGLVWLFASLLSGCSNILAETDDLDRSIDVFSRESVTLAGAGTTSHLAYLAHQRQRIQPIFPDVRALVGSGAPKPADLVDQVRSTFDAPVLSGYGSTEAPMLTMAAITDADEELSRSEGRPVHGVELRLIQSDGRPAQPGEEGEIRVRAPQLMLGYTDPALDVDAFDDDGFFCTGDLGRLDPQGNLVVSGPRNDLIVADGEHISARALEELLLRHDKVAEVAVIGLPDADAGERVCAVVRSAAGESLSFDEMIVHLRDHGHGGRTSPQRLEIVDTLPRNTSGAILKHVLRDEFKG